MVRMGPFFFIHLLLMALLLQYTEEKEELRRQKPPKHDEAVHHQEFCLSIPEAPRSTGLVFATPQPTKSASKPKPARKKAKTSKLSAQQPKQPDDSRTPMSRKKTYPSAGVPEIVPMIAPSNLYSSGRPVKVSDGCYCKNKKLSTEIYQVSRLNIHYPSETCRSTEYIEIFNDGRKVCVTHFSVVTHFFRSLSKPVPEQRSTESPEISSTTHQSTTAKTSTTTLLAIRTDGSQHLSDSNAHYGPAPNGLAGLREIQGPAREQDESMSRGDFVDLQDDVSHLVVGPAHREAPPKISFILEPCIRCISLVTWNNFDLKDVQLVELNFPKSNCPAFILVRLTDGRHVCMDSFHSEFQKLLDKLEIKEP